MHNFFIFLTIRPCVPHVFRVLDGPCFLLLFTSKYSISKFSPFYLLPCIDYLTKMNKDRDKRDMFGLWRSMPLDECTVFWKVYFEAYIIMELASYCESDVINYDTCCSQTIGNVLCNCPCRSTRYWVITDLKSRAGTCHVVFHHSQASI
jgi:hypothetical protein